jgi:hypothetical protein
MEDRVCCSICRLLLEGLQRAAGRVMRSPLLEVAHVFVLVTALCTAQESVLLQGYQVLPLHLIHSGFYGLFQAAAARQQHCDHQQRR